ncbi:sulfatase-like hydrolase/transferase [bacterium]|nr:sulfatase-like hydrolase/transferase [bacterium]
MRFLTIKLVFIRSILVVTIMALSATISDTVFSLHNSEPILTELSTIGFSFFRSIHTGFFSDTTDIQSLKTFAVVNFSNLLNFSSQLFIAWFSIFLPIYLLNLCLGLFIFFRTMRSFHTQAVIAIPGTLFGFAGALSGLIFSSLYLHTFSPFAWITCLVIFSVIGLYIGKAMAGILLKISVTFKSVLQKPFTYSLVLLLILVYILVLSTGHFGPSGIGPNILVIVVDTLREDALGIGGRNDACSPEIDRFFQHEIQLTNIRADSSWTAPSFASLFCGMEPYKHGVTEGDIFFKPNIKTLAETFQQNNYDTFALLCNPVLQGDNGYNRGFDIYQNRLFAREATDTLNTTQGLIPVLKHSERFFLLIQFMD